jgi:hypothetical protein
MSTKKTLIKIKLIEEGLLPASTGFEVTEMLKSLSSEDKRKFKRKFRKRWRKIAKSGDDFAEMMGLGEKKPTSRQKALRSVRVYQDASKKI